MNTYNLVNCNKYFLIISSAIENNDNLNNADYIVLKFKKHSRIESMKKQLNVIQ